MGPAMVFAGASAAMDLLGGVFSYMASNEAAKTAESRGRMLRMEAEADALRYAEQARGFKAQQKVAYLKSGVDLSGSPLAILDESARVAQENISAIRARGEAAEMGQKQQAAQARAGGRMALVNAVSSSTVGVGKGIYQGVKADAAAKPTNNTGWID
jgi:hypothetical protein